MDTQICRAEELLRQGLSPEKVPFAAGAADTELGGGK